MAISLYTHPASFVSAASNVTLMVSAMRIAGASSAANVTTSFPVMAAMRLVTLLWASCGILYQIPAGVYPFFDCQCASHPDK